MKLLTGLFVALMTTTAVAQDNSKYDLTGRWGLGLGAGMSSIDGSDAFTEGAGELDSKFAMSFWGRYHMSPRMAVEFAYTRLMYEFVATGAPLNEMDPSAGVFDVSLAYRMFPKKVYHILLQAGVGYVRYKDFDATNTDDIREDFAIKGRIGFEYMLTPDLMLALQTDYYRLNYGSSGPNYMSVWAPMFALTYYFGKANAEAAAPVVAAPMDSDGDGVVDADDQCPGTPAGQKVTAYGCAQTEKLEIALNVQFASGKSDIDAKFTADLEKFAAFLTKHPETKAEIAGHTDNTGSEKMNTRISQKRADAVKKYLVDTMKVDQTRLTAKGYGPSQPTADNTTPEGREKNRRVVANVKTEAPVVQEATKEPSK
jgi:outer membrane protein OmpA-like peptidoglycan-associated protein